MSMGDEARRLREADQARRQDLENQQEQMAAQWVSEVEQCAQEMAAELRARGWFSRSRTHREVSVPVSRYPEDDQTWQVVRVGESGRCSVADPGYSTTTHPLTPRDVISHFPSLASAQIRQSFTGSLAAALDEPDATDAPVKKRRWWS